MAVTTSKGCDPESVDVSIKKKPCRYWRKTGYCREEWGTLTIKLPYDLDQPTLKVQSQNFPLDVISSNVLSRQTN